MREAMALSAAWARDVVENPVAKRSRPSTATPKACFINSPLDAMSFRNIQDVARVAGASIDRRTGPRVCRIKVLIREGKPNVQEHQNALQLRSSSDGGRDPC